MPICHIFVYLITSIVSIYIICFQSDEVGQRIRTAYGDGIVKNLRSLTSEDGCAYTVTLSYGVAYVCQSVIFHTIPVPLTSNEKNFVRLNGKFNAIEDKLDVEDAAHVKSGCLAIFGTEKLYLFLRLYCVLVRILAEGNACLSRSNTYASPATQSTNGSEVPSEEKTNEVKGRGAIASAVLQPGSADRVGQHYRGYAGLIAALKDNLKGKMNSKAFETCCRLLSRDNVFKLALLPRILEKCADSLLKVVEEDAYPSLLDYARIPQMDISLLRSLSLEVTDDATYRIQYDPAAQSMMCCYLPKDALLVVTPKNLTSSAGDDMDADGDDEAEDTNLAVDEVQKEEENVSDEEIGHHMEEGQIVDDDETEEDRTPSSKRAKLK